MSTNFPSALDTFTNPNGSDSLNAAAVPHAEQHANANDAIEALQAKVGINGSAVATSLDYRISTAETGLDGKISSSEKGSANGVATLGFYGKVPSSQLPPLDYIPTSEKGVPGGVAGLDEAGKVPAAQLPSYVDDVLEYANLAAFPVTGEAGKIYVALDTNKTYRWSGSAYIYITSGAVDSVAGKTGVVVLTKADVGLGSVDNTSDANKPVSTATQTALNAKQDTLVSGTNIKTINNQSILGAGNIEIQGGVGVGVALSGDLNIYVTQSKTYTITNYNVFSSYIVQVSAGSVSLSGDQISFTAPAAAQTVTLTVTMDSAAMQFSLVVQAAGVTTPTNSSPSNGATDQNGMVTLTSSAFAWYGLSDTHLNSDWQLATDAGFTSIVQSTSADATNKTGWTVSGLSTSQTYYWRVRHRGTNNGVSSWSTGTSFATKASYAYVNTPTVTTPTNGQTEIPEQPTLQSSAFATTGSADTHASSQWQIRLAGGTWAAPLHDSGASTTNKTSYTVPAGVLVAGQTQYVMRVRHTGTSLGASEWSSDIAFTTKQQFAQIIGIVCTATGGGAGTWQRIDENFNAITTTAATFNNHPTYAGVVAQTIDGQAMMKVPKYYLKTGTVPSGTYAGNRYWMVSDQPVAGFSVHPAFMNAGAQIDQFWVGKYQGTNDGGTKLGSAAGTTPLVSIDFPTMQTRANNRNTGGVTGFGLWNIYQLSAIKTLALIEMGGSDSQTLVGQGHVSGSSALAVDNATVAQATWRGIVGLWGNVWQMVDGLQTDASSKFMVWDKNGNKTYKTSSLTAPTSGTYPVTMATTTGTDYDLGTVFTPETTNASAASATFPDIFYSGASCVAYHGGAWSNGAGAGLFCLYVHYAASNSYAYVGGRLAKV